MFVYLKWCWLVVGKIDRSDEGSRRHGRMVTSANVTESHSQAVALLSARVRPSVHPSTSRFELSSSSSTSRRKRLFFGEKKANLGDSKRPSLSSGSPMTCKCSQLTKTTNHRHKSNRLIPTQTHPKNEDCNHWRSSRRCERRGKSKTSRRSGRHFDASERPRRFVCIVRHAVLSLAARLQIEKRWPFKRPRVCTPN